MMLRGWNSIAKVVLKCIFLSKNTTYMHYHWLIKAYHYRLCYLTVIVGMKTKVITIGCKLAVSVGGRACPYYLRLRGEPPRRSEWGTCTLDIARRGLPHTIGGGSPAHHCREGDGSPRAPGLLLQGVQPPCAMGQQA